MEYRIKKDFFFSSEEIKYTQSNPIHTMHHSIKQPKHPPGTGLSAPLQGRRGGTSMSPLAPPPESQTHISPLVPRSCCCSGSPVYWLDQAQIAPWTGLPRGSGGTQRNPANASGPCTRVSSPAPSQSSLLQPGALQSPHHSSCWGSVPGW